MHTDTRFTSVVTLSELHDTTKHVFNKQNNVNLQKDLLGISLQQNEHSKIKHKRDKRIPYFEYHALKITSISTQCIP